MRLPFSVGLFLIVNVPLSSFAGSPPLVRGAGPEVDLPRVAVLSSDPLGLEMTFELLGLAVEEVTLGERSFQSVSIPGGGFVGEPGHPEIPTFSRFVAIPDRAGVRVRAVIEEEEELPGISLAPVQDLDGGPFLYDAEAYARDDFGEEPGARAGEPGLLRDLRVVPLTFQPVRYNPARGVLRVARRIRVTVSFEGEDLRNVKGSAPRSIPTSFDALYRALVVNYAPSDTELGAAPGTWVVICQNDDDVTARLQPLLDWRKRKGFRTRLATFAETGSTAESIKAWLQNAYDTWEVPPEYVVLAGDATGYYSVPTWHETLSGMYGEGDMPYVQLEGGDWFPDVHIGRLSFDYIGDLEAIVNKIVGYESTPYLEDPGWYTRACLVGDPNASGLSTVIVQQLIKDRLRDIGYTEIDTIYADPFVPQMLQALNQGDTIFSYRGTAGMSGWSNSHTYTLTNGWKMPFVVTITCGTGSFAGGTAVSEGFLRANGGVDSPKGGIGAIGTATSGTHTRFNNCVHYGIFRGLLSDNLFPLGAALTRGKLELYLNYNVTHPNQAIYFSHWNNLMGDPALECWTGFPAPLRVTRPQSIPLGANAVTVTVESGFGFPFPGAQVCLVKGTETHAVGFTDAQGAIELPVTVATTGEMQLTVTKHNFHPHLSTIPVTAEPVYVGYVASAVDDDNSGESSGNGDGIVNPSETIELPVRLRNYGLLTATGVSATLSSADPYVTILDAEEAFGDIGPGATAWSADDFDVAIDPACQHGYVIRFGLDITAAQGSWHSLIDLPVVSADLVAEGTTLYNAGGNGIFDPDETVDLGITLRNNGGADAATVTGTLISESPFVTVLDGTGSWGAIPVGFAVENRIDRFRLAASRDTYEGHLAVLRLVTDFSGGLRDTTAVTVTVGQRSSDDPVGPDLYGYYAFDNTDTAYPEAPTYQWTEIDPNYAGMGTQVPLTDHGTYQDDSAVIDLPFTFNYYGQGFTKVTICSNGWVAMGSTWLVNYRNWTLPGAGSPDGIACLFWDDLWIPTGGGVYTFHDQIAHRFIIEYSRLFNEPGGSETAEMILYDPLYYPTPSGDGTILFQYQTVTNNDGGDNYATVGIESPDGADGLLYTYGGLYASGAATLASGRAIRFLPINANPLGTLTGMVRNASNNQAPLPDAEVMLLETGRTFVSGLDGRYTGTTPAGTYTVAAQHTSFEPDTAYGVVIVEGEATALDFDLIDIVPPAITTTTHASTSDTANAYPIPVTIVEYSGMPEKALNYKTYGQAFTALPLASQGGDDYLAEIPPQNYITRVEYYVYARDGQGLEATDPPGAPAEVYSFFVTPTVVLFHDDMEADAGWAVGAPDDDATVGIWERVDPVGTFNSDTMVQPEDDHTQSPGTDCFVTDGRGGAQGDYDVDGGKTTLISPRLDLTSYGTVTLRYYRWYTNDTGNEPGQDVWVVEVSNDDGQIWVTLENTFESDRTWRSMEFDLTATMEMTDAMRIRYVASDYGGGSVVEAGVDDVELLLTGVVDAPDGPVVPMRFSLMPSRPNPSRVLATIGFSLERPSHARLAIYDVQGRLVRRLIDGLRSAGPQSVTWDGRDQRGETVASGIYFYQLEAEGGSDVRKMIRLE